MPDTTGDPLYRSDTRAAPSGAQQADLAPVSDQPDEHWEQQAQAREAEEPAAPTDPLGAQPETPQPDHSEPDVSSSSPRQAEAQPQAQPAAQPEAQSQSGSAEPASAAPDEERTSTADDQDTAASRDVSGGATFGHDTSLSLGGEATWTDGQGEHVRSGEITIDLSHATSLGGSLTTAQTHDGLSNLSDALSGSTGALASAQAALTEAVSEAQGAVAIIADGALSEVSGLVEGLPTTLDDATAPALAAVEGALDTVSPLAEGGAPALDALAGSAPDLGGAVPETGGGGGLLAALFTPTEALDAAPAHSPSTEALPDLDLGGLLGAVDDHPDIGHPGL